MEGGWGLQLEPGNRILCCLGHVLVLHLNGTVLSLLSDFFWCLQSIVVSQKHFLKCHLQQAEVGRSGRRRLLPELDQPNIPAQFWSEIIDSIPNNIFVSHHDGCLSWDLMVICCHKLHWVKLKKAIRSKQGKGNVIEDWFGLQKRLLHRAQIKTIHRCLCQRTNETTKVRIDMFCQS